MFVAVNKEKERVNQELATIEKFLLSISITKDDDEKSTERKVTLVQETAEHIDHSIGKIQALMHQQNNIVIKLNPLINKLPDEMEAKKILLESLAELENTVAQMDTAMKAVCEQNQILQNQIETILGEQELAMRDLRKQVENLSQELIDQKKAYYVLQTKHQKTESEFQLLYDKHHPMQAG